VSSGRRITFALVGLVLLAVIGYLVKGHTGHSDPHDGNHGAPASGLPTRLLPVLPAQVGHIYRLIEPGGSPTSLTVGFQLCGTQDGLRFCANAAMPS
jgi:hypothetical protein